MKKKISISDSELKLIVILVAMSCLAIAYFFGFNKGMTNAKMIEEECVQIQAEIDTLQTMIDNRIPTEKETENYKKQVVEVTEKYPVDVPEEKALFILQQMQDGTGIVFNSINYVGANKVADNGRGVAGYYDQITVTLLADYETYKEFMTYITQNKDRMNVEKSSVSYDQETGQLSGLTTFRMYYLTGTGKEYEDIPDLEIESSVENIFGSK